MTTQNEEEHHSASDVGGAKPQLVFGDDGSPAADVVWLWINNHQWTGWRIAVMTAKPPGLPPVGSARATPHPWEPPNPRHLLAQDDVPVEHLLAEADPRVALDSFRDAALMAVGPRGQGVLKHLHLGSTTEWLIGAHRPLAPVVILRSGASTQRVLLCVDGSEHAREAVSALGALPWLGQCEALVLGVDDADNLTGPAVEDAARALERSGAGKVRSRVVPSSRRPGHRDVRSVILSTVDEEGADLVALGARGIGGITGLLVGSVAANVVHHATCSVLIAKAP
jgi:nucleotide-binding universal stress UspA family protein